jgi:hypothetical protein
MTTTLAQELGLPAGWTATRFPNVIELEKAPVFGMGRPIRTGIPVPYNPMTKEQWVAAANKAIEEITRQHPNL